MKGKPITTTGATGTGSRKLSERDKWDIDSAVLLAGLIEELERTRQQFQPIQRDTIAKFQILLNRFKLKHP